MNASRPSALDQVVHDLDRSLFTYYRRTPSHPGAEHRAPRDQVIDLDLGSSRLAFVSRLRAVAEHLERGVAFQVRVAGRMLSVPADARCSIALDRGDRNLELQFRLRWGQADGRTAMHG